MQPNNPYEPSNNQEPAVVVSNDMTQPASTAPVVSQSAAFTSSPAMSSSAPMAASTGGASSMKKVVVGVFVVLLLAGGWGARVAASALSSNGAESTARAMVAALVKGDSAKAYSLTSQDLKNQETAGALMQAVGDVQTTKATYTDENVQVNGSSAVYVATVDNLPADDSGNTSAIFVVSLSKQGLTSWKVDDVTVQ